MRSSSTKTLLIWCFVALLCVQQAYGALSAQASHILMDSEADIDALHAEIEAASDVKAKFAELARANSKCPSSKRGGDLGTFGRGRMVPEFDQAVFEQEVGKVHKVKTQFGWHLVLTMKVSDDGEEEWTLYHTVAQYLNKFMPFLSPLILIGIMYCGQSYANRPKGPRAHAFHILVKTEEEVDELMKLITSAENPKEKLKELAPKYSKCPSGGRGGDLGMFDRGQMVPQFDKVVFEEDVGKVHKVQTQFGWHVVLCTERLWDKKKDDKNATEKNKDEKKKD